MSQQPPSPVHNDFEQHLPHKETGDTEEIYYQGSPLVRGEIGKIFFWFIFGLAIIAAPFVYTALHKDHYWWPWWGILACVVVGLILLVIPILIVKSIRYRISNYRIDIERGILGKRIDTLELWHVEDIKFDQSFLDRLLGVGNITIISHDDTTPRLPMIGLPKPRELFEKVKQRVIAVKRQRGVVKMDLGGHGSPDTSS